MSSNTGKTVKVIYHLGELLTQLLEVDVGALPPAAQLECLQAILPVARRVDAMQLRLVGVIDKRDTIQATGCASAAVWLRNVLRVSNAVGMVRSAAALSTLPKVSAAFAAGEIDHAHVATIAKVVKAVPPELAAGMEPVLVDQARQLPPSKFAPVAARIRNETVPPSQPPEHKPEPPKADARWMRIGRGRDGSLAITAAFDARGGDLLMAALRSADRKRSSVGRRRDLDARRADALLEVCRGAIATRSGFRSGSTATAPRGTSAAAPARSTDGDVRPAVGAAKESSKTRLSDVSNVGSPRSGSRHKQGQAGPRLRRRKRHHPLSAKR